MTLYGRVVDIGEGGLFLRTAVSLSAGTPVDVHISPEGSQDQIRARGVVKWSGMRADDSARTPGIGIAFESVVVGQDSLNEMLDYAVGDA